jgi:hypothetical protein
VKNSTVKECAANILAEGRNSRTQGEVEAFWVSARRVMTFAGFDTDQIDAVCGRTPPQLPEPEEEERSRYVD